MWLVYHTKCFDSSLDISDDVVYVLRQIYSISKDACLFYRVTSKVILRHIVIFNLAMNFCFLLVSLVFPNAYVCNYIMREYQEYLKIRALYKRNIGYNCRLDGVFKWVAKNKIVRILYCKLEIFSSWYPICLTNPIHFKKS